jgi:dienelactone hydrolase
MSNEGLTRRGFLQTTSKIAGATLVGSSGHFLTPPVLRAQTNTDEVETVLKQQIQTEDVVEFQLRQYLMKRVPPLPTPASADEWTAQEKQLRKHILDHVIFHGWPREWVSAPPKFEDVGTIESVKGYRTRKLRYEIVPGFWSTALLYEPGKLAGKIPATINLNGHDPRGKATEYKQRRCINNALQGMLALSLEWLGMGEMAKPENDHWFGAHLNLVGASATGLFYLAMRKGLDYLYEHPNVDRERIGVTGLSGGAWQTIMLSALDERVAVAIPVAGYFAFASAVERNSDVGDMEYHPPDLFVGCDYTTLTAMRAPRPTLLIYGAKDEYGLRAPLQKPHLYDEINPFFRLYGKEEAFAWYSHIEPGTHNYQLDNRQQSYAFFTEHFNMPVVEREIPVDDEVRSYEELAVGLPKDNLTIVSLAKRLAAENKRRPVPSDAASRAEWARSARTRLKQLIRYHPVTVKRVWPVSSTWNEGIETLSYQFEFSNELSATGVWLKSPTTPTDAPIAILLDDSGVTSVRSEVLSNINRGEQVLAVNLIFTGDASPNTPKDRWSIPTLYTELYSSTTQLPGVEKWLRSRPPSALYGLLLAASGDQPIGMEAAQLIGVTKWLQETNRSPRVVLESTGIRSQVTTLVASALEPKSYHELVVREAMRSFGYLLDKPVRYQEAPDLFCLDLYKEFDIDSLAALAEPTKVVQTFMDNRSD